MDKERINEIAKNASDLSIMAFQANIMSEREKHQYPDTYMAMISCIENSLPILVEMAVKTAINECINEIQKDDRQ